MNADDPQLPRLLAVTPAADPTFLLALEVARDAIAGKLQDPTANADSYYAASIPAPYWTSKAVFTAAIGGNRFFRLELPPSTHPFGSVPAPVGASVDDRDAVETARLNGRTN